MFATQMLCATLKCPWCCPSWRTDTTGDSLMTDCCAFSKSISCPFLHRQSVFLKLLNGSKFIHRYIPLQHWTLCPEAVNRNERIKNVQCAGRRRHQIRWSVILGPKNKVAFSLKGLFPPELSKSNDWHKSYGFNAKTASNMKHSLL